MKHPEIKIYDCTICEEKYVSVRGLAKHESTKHGLWNNELWSVLKYFLHLPNRSWCFVGIYSIDWDFYTKSLKILIWLIKVMINSGKNGYFRFFSDPNPQIFVAIGGKVEWFV